MIRPPQMLSVPAAAELSSDLSSIWANILEAVPPMTYVLFMNTLMCSIL